MRKTLRLILLAIIATTFAGCAVSFLGPPGWIPRVLGTGGFVSRIVEDAPHPFAFDRPRFWDDRSDGLHRSGEKWNVLTTGPVTDDRAILVTLGLVVRPEASRSAEYPIPGGPFTSLDDFAKRMLPTNRRDIRTTTAIVAGRAAQDVTYDYAEYRLPLAARPETIPCRGRAVILEDRGYYYMLSYRTRDSEYERYVGVFERMVSTFRFLD